MVSDETVQKTRATRTYVRPHCGWVTNRVLQVGRSKVGRRQIHPLGEIPVSSPLASDPGERQV